MTKQHESVLTSSRRRSITKQIQQRCRKWPKGHRKFDVLNNDPYDVLQYWGSVFPHQITSCNINTESAYMEFEMTVVFTFLLKLSNCFSVRVCTRHAGIPQNIFNRLRWWFDKRLLCLCLLISSLWSSSEKEHLFLPVALLVLLTKTIKNVLIPVGYFLL